MSWWILTADHAVHAIARSRGRVQSICHDALAKEGLAKPCPSQLSRERTNRSSDGRNMNLHMRRRNPRLLNFADPGYRDCSEGLDSSSRAWC